MSTENPPRDPKNRAKIECHALGRCLMPHNDNSAGLKLITLAFVVVWGVVTIGLAYNRFDVVLPPYYGILTAIVFLIIGRQWDIEVERLLPATDQLTDTDPEPDDTETEK